MTDQRLTQCLVLCRQAQELQGDALAQTLSDLQLRLQWLQEDAPEATIEVPHDEPIISMDLAGYLTGWNAGAQILFGYTQEEAIGRHVLFLYADTPDDLNAQLPELFLEEGSSCMEVRRRRKSGEIFRADLSLTQVLDDDGEPVGLVAHLSEIADRLSPKEKLRLHARIIEDSDQGILIVDTDERIVSVNSAFSRITGFSAGEAIGQTPTCCAQACTALIFAPKYGQRCTGPAPGKVKSSASAKTASCFRNRSRSVSYGKMMVRSPMPFPSFRTSACCGQPKSGCSVWSTTTA